MSLKLFLYPYLLFLVIAQISPQNITTLLTLTDNSSNYDSLLSRAASCILQAHPQLGNFTIQDIKNSSIGNNTNTTGILLALSDGLDKIIVIVSLQTDTSPFVVSYTKVTIEEDIQVLGTNSSDNVSNNHSSGGNNTQNKAQTKPPQATFPNMRQEFYQAQNSMRPLGGFFPLQNYSQPRFIKALGYLLSIHSSLSSYSQQATQYQIVSGVNYLFSFSSAIVKIRIQARVYTSLDGSTSLLDFIVLCHSQAENCNTLKARRLFDGIQHLIKTHAQLLDYKLSSVHVQSSNDQQLYFMCSFDNQYLGLRSTADLKVMNASINVLSFYSYQYQ